MNFFPHYLLATYIFFPYIMASRKREFELLSIFLFVLSCPALPCCIFHPDIAVLLAEELIPHSHLLIE